MLLQGYCSTHLLFYFIAHETTTLVLSAGLLLGSTTSLYTVTSHYSLLLIVHLFCAVNDVVQGRIWLVGGLGPA